MIRNFEKRIRRLRGAQTAPVLFADLCPDGLYPLPRRGYDGRGNFEDYRTGGRAFDSVGLSAYQQENGVPLVIIDDLEASYGRTYNDAAQSAAEKQ